MEILNDYSWVRGVNHYMSSGEQLKKELGYGKRVNLNSVRFWLDYRSYAADKTGYIERVVRYTRECYECGYRVMPIIWNGNMLDPHMIDEENYPAGDEYASAIVNALKDEPGLLMWDIMNEPSCNDWIFGEKDHEIQKAKYEKMWGFVRRYCAFVKNLDHKNAITVGHTTAVDIEPTADSVDVLSFHDYNGTSRSIDANYSLADSLSKKYGKPVLQTETGCLARANPYDMALAACQKYNMGWFVYELIIHGRCDSEHGVFYPDGTVRDPATIAAMMGCFRNRGEGIVLPIPNREGAADRAVEMIKNALTEYTCDGFDYRPSDKEKLLEACEYAAYLLEGCDMIPMAYPPTAKIAKFRRDVDTPLLEIRQFAFELAKELKEICQIL